MTCSSHIARGAAGRTSPRVHSSGCMRRAETKALTPYLTRGFDTWRACTALKRCYCAIGATYRVPGSSPSASADSGTIRDSRTPNPCCGRGFCVSGRNAAMSPDPFRNRRRRRMPPYGTSRRNSCRVMGQSRNDPLMALVTVREFCRSTPRIIMQRCCASMTTPTPRGSIASMTASAI